MVLVVPVVVLPVTMLGLSLELIEQICHFCDPTTATRLCSTCRDLYKTCLARAPGWRLAHFQEAPQKATFHPPVLEEDVYELDYNTDDESDGDARYNHSYLVIALQPEAMVEVVNKLPWAAGAQIAAGLKLTESAIHAMIDVLLKPIRDAVVSSPEEGHFWDMCTFSLYVNYQSNLSLSSYLIRGLHTCSS